MIQKQHEGQRRAPQSDDLAFEVCQPEAQVSQGDGAPNGHEVPVIGAGLHDGATLLFSVFLDRMSSPRLPSTRCVPSSSRTQRPAARRRRSSGRACGGGVVHNVRELLLQLQIVQREAVAVVGYAEAVRGLAVGGSSEVGADPGGQPGARVGALGQQRLAAISREEAVGDSDLIYRRPAWHRSADAGTLPGLP